jgi:phenylacetate-CoA ligase
MRRSFMPAITTEDELAAVQLAGLQWTVGHAYHGSEFYRVRFDDAGVGPADIRSLDDLRRLPFTTASDLREGYPFPLRSVPFDQIVRVHSSSGTTGLRKVLSYTQKDIDDWRDLFARCYEMAGVGPGDRVQLMVGYGLWTAGVGFQAGCEAVGATAIPIGPGNLDMQAQFLVDLQPNVICCTASMALLISEEIGKRGLTDKVNIERIILGSERCGDAMRERIQELSGAQHIFDITGMTELYGPGAGIDCEQHAGIHYWADAYILELLDPETLEPVPAGELGEIVVTTLHKEGAPLVRYRTRDLTRAIPGRCACGSILPRHDRLMGRSDDMFIIKATNVYPGQIDDILGNVEGVSSEFNVILERAAGRDSMTIKVERDPNGSPDRDAVLARDVEKCIKSSIQVSGEVQIVDYGSLPRSERKSRRVFDNR